MPTSTSRSSSWEDLVDGSSRLEEDARPRVVPRAARGIATRPAGVVARDMSRREVEVMLGYLSTYLYELSVLSIVR
jgi:hypothetical protein